MVAQAPDSIRLRLYGVVTARLRYDAARRDIKDTGGMLFQAAREYLGMTQREIGERLGIDNTYVSHLERGRVNLSDDIAEKLLDMLEAKSVEPAPAKSGRSAQTV